jgi:hypothetical protein
VRFCVPVSVQIDEFRFPFLIHMAIHPYFLRIVAANICVKTGNFGPQTSGLEWREPGAHAAQEVCVVLSEWMLQARCWTSADRRLAGSDAGCGMSSRCGGSE